MYTITTNAKGTRSINISDDHIATIQRYNLLNNLLGSDGATEEALERLRLHTRSLLESVDDKVALLTLCKEVLFHDNMKAVGLQNLIDLCKTMPEIEAEPATEE